MALLNRWRIAALLTLSAAGCLLVSQQPDPGPHFAHGQHRDMSGLTCAQCHAGALTRDSAGMPGPQLCAPCHEDADEDEPSAYQPLDFFDVDGRYLAQRLAALSDEVMFSHAAHRGVTCSECHGDVATSDLLPDSVRVTKSNCLDCHQREGQQTECADCHREIDARWVPPTHGGGWNAHHGQVVHARDPAIQNDCAMCHQQSTCEACHREVAPASHTNFWRVRGHGIATSINRTSCTVCHRTDSCERCHQSTRPRSHSGSFGHATNRHCATCHFPLRGEGCFTCHKSAPSHDLATPLPANHNPAMNCRACHGAGVALPHLDGGHACTNCHR